MTVLSPTSEIYSPKGLHSWPRLLFLLLKSGVDVSFFVTTPNALWDKTLVPLLFTWPPVPTRGSAGDVGWLLTG